MEEVQRCVACKKQETLGRRDGPHADLVVMQERPGRSIMGGWEETDYRCRVCSSTMTHTNDKNEFAPYWWFTN